jgi:hypothetical protein
LSTVRARRHREADVSVRLAACAQKGLQDNEEEKAVLGLTRCFAAASLGSGRIRGRFTNQFGRHQTGDEKLPAVIVEIDRGVFGVGFGDNSKTVLLMLNLLTVRKYLHDCLLGLH